MRAQLARLNSNLFRQFVHHDHMMRQHMHISASGALESAYACLKRGDVIAVPTDTLYGLSCHANNKEAVKKLYAIKGRDDNKPVAICVHNLAALRRYGHAEHLSDALLQQLLPGPITIIIERTSELSNPLLNPHTNRIGIRIPDFNFIRELCALDVEEPLALTSANRSGALSSLSVTEFAELWPQLGMVCDAGQLGLSEEQRLGSTIIDLSVPNMYQVVRQGVAYKKIIKILHEHNITAVEQCRIKQS